MSSSNWPTSGMQHTQGSSAQDRDTYSPVAMCSSVKCTPSMLTVPRKGLPSWKPPMTTEFHSGSNLRHGSVCTPISACTPK